MRRVISPPPEEFSSLRTPLEEGELRVFELLDEQLDRGWEIYVRPHMNGLRPDFVLVHPRAGIIAIEVKDWSLSTLRDSYRAGDNPVAKALLYRKEILKLYCPHLDPTCAPQLVNCAIVFTNIDHDAAQSLLWRDIFACFGKIADFPFDCHIAGRAELNSGQLGRLLPMAIRNVQKGMTSEAAEDMRHWLREPVFSAEQRRDLPLDEHQRVLVRTRTPSGFRKITGPAGAGKSMVLAARAAHLISEGKRVLVVCFNITLLNYLKDLAVRCRRDLRRRALDQADWLNFHKWCQRVMLSVGEIEEYNRFWRQFFDRHANPESNSVDDKALDDALSEQLPGVIARVLDRHPDRVEQYDAVLVDEGQDFRPSWWRVLRRCVKKGGEMLLVADATQDIYGRNILWTPPTLQECGLPAGRWVQLKRSYRPPAQVISHLEDFVRRFLPAADCDPPSTAVQLTMDQQLEPCYLRWVHVPSGLVEHAAVDEILRLASGKTKPELPVADITLMATSHDIGYAIVTELNANSNIRTIHTFSPRDRSAARPRKLAFYKGDARVKGTTIHSFKGLESRAIVVCFGSGRARPLFDSDYRLLFTAISRLMHSEEGAYLTVVSSAPELRDFGLSWADHFEWVPDRVRVRKIVAKLLGKAPGPQDA